MIYLQWKIFQDRDNMIYKTKITEISRLLRSFLSELVKEEVWSIKVWTYQDLETTKNLFTIKALLQNSGSDQVVELKWTKQALNSQAQELIQIRVWLELKEIKIPCILSWNTGQLKILEVRLQDQVHMNLILTTKIKPQLMEPVLKREISELLNIFSHNLLPILTIQIKLSLRKEPLNGVSDLKREPVLLMRNLDIYQAQVTTI